MENTSLNILIVDDDPLVRELLSELLSSDKYFVETAGNGKDALVKISAEPCFDLILSDMNMPVMDGLELIDILHEQNNDIPIIILTVNDKIDVAVKAMKKGASDYLLKDENIEDTIFMAIEKVMDKSRLQKQNALLMEELKKKNRELERLAFSDGLTGIPNRRYFDAVFKKEWERAIRETSPIATIMADIDYFKMFNDHYGHLHGDDCLKAVAKVLNETLKRPGDMIGRYGGEEFIAVLPCTDVDGGYIIAEKMRQNVEKLDIPHDKSLIADMVTVSMGVAGVVPFRNSQPSQLITLVDQALYSAKGKGRNRVISYDSIKNTLKPENTGGC